MEKRSVLLLFLLLGFCAHAQKITSTFRLRNYHVVSDSIRLDSVAINSQQFTVTTSTGERIPKTAYRVDFNKAMLYLNSKKYTEITVAYYRFPEFITKVYMPFDKRRMVPNETNTGELYYRGARKKKAIPPVFEGLETQGFIVRGLTSGNNQNAVTNATLDMTISGKLSNDITLRAHIFDTNIPLQQNGYSQNITDFDRVFMEIAGKKWALQGGDIVLKNTESTFLNFSKQVAGVSIEAAPTEKTTVSGAGALVRGQYTSRSFTGIAGNQGPYSLQNTGSQSALILIAGSERVFVNGVLVAKGANNAYLIDYNLGEIRFNTTYPIRNDMRIHVEFQYAEQNYTRFVSFEKAQYKSNRLEINGFYYHENDVKHQSLQQSLNTEQIEILANAGNNTQLMTAENAVETGYTDGLILYKKTTGGTSFYFEHSTEPQDVLYTVAFTYAGEQQGDYILESSSAIGPIYQFAGTNLGNYLPVTQLVAPTRLAIMAVNAQYQPSEKTSIQTELAFSNNDSNLFSSLDDENNQGMAAKIGWKQSFGTKQWQLKNDFRYQFVANQFKTIERHQAIEYQRDWNLINPSGDQQEIGSTLTWNHQKGMTLAYAFKQLIFGDAFTGNKHEIATQFKRKNTDFSVVSSVLNNSTPLETAHYAKTAIAGKHLFSKNWVGAEALFENNNRKDPNTQNLQATSFRFAEYQAYIGRGDSTGVYAKIGVRYRKNDSILNTAFARVNTQKSGFIESTLLRRKNTHLGLFANYSSTTHAAGVKTKTIHTQLKYQQQFFQKIISLNTLYETNAGNSLEQEYVYVKTVPGQGFYTWIDYNGDGIQQFNEFEIAQFQDQADYLRVALPTLRYIPTQRVHWKQTLTLNPSQWKNTSGFKKQLSRFYNHSTLFINNEQLQEANTFHWNPFLFEEARLRTLAASVRNQLYFNRNKEKYQLIYTYGASKNKQQYSIGTQENNSVLHQITTNHRLSSFWKIAVQWAVRKQQSLTENFSNRNFNIHQQEISPTLTFLVNKNHRLALTYQYKDKRNQLASAEQLQQQELAADYVFSSKKDQELTATVHYYTNDFTGDPNSPVGYQLLEGLQTGTNFTWSLGGRKKLNKLLQLRVSYMGRKSERSKTIHTGSIQLRANF